LDSEPTIRDMLKGLHSRMDRQDRSLDRIEQKATETNGRVTELEKAEAISKALGERAEEERIELQAGKQDRVDRLSNLQAVMGGSVASVVLLAVGHHFHLL
jgi:uncharacterized membrane protein